MSDYINRKELIENLNTFAPEHYNALINMLIEKQPSVDVVSRSEYERVKGVLDNTIKTYADCMKEYAGYIFDELEERCEVGTDLLELHEILADLKKKYVGDKS